MKPAFTKLSVASVIGCAVCLLTLTTVQAAHVDNLMWIIEFQEMLGIDKTAYPASNFGPYFQKASTIREAAARGDDAAVRSQLGEVVQMLIKGDIDEDAAADLVNFVHYWQAAYTPKTKSVRNK